jgi:hypothetical protein
LPSEEDISQALVAVPETATPTRRHLGKRGPADDDNWRCHCPFWLPEQSGDSSKSAIRSSTINIQRHHLRRVAVSEEKATLASSVEGCVSLQ